LSPLFEEGCEGIEASVRQRQQGAFLISDAGNAQARVSTVTVENLLRELKLNQPKDLSPVRLRQREKAMALIRDEALVDTAHCFKIVPLEEGGEGDRLRAGGEILPLPERLPKKGVMTAFGCGAYTLGPRLDARVSELFRGKRAAIALALDALGNELLMALGGRMRSELLASVRRQGLILGQRLRAGESGFDLPSQAAILRLAGAGEIGIDLHRDNLLRPQKSTVAVFAIGHKLPKLSLSRYRE
jgi:hypothetical protein